MRKMANNSLNNFVQLHTPLYIHRYWSAYTCIHFIWNGGIQSSMGVPPCIDHNNVARASLAIDSRKCGRPCSQHSPANAHTTCIEMANARICIY